MNRINKHITQVFAILFCLNNATFSQNILINEVVSSNLYSYFDQYGDNSDWIELYNTTNNSVYLGNFYLSDDETNYIKWSLPDTYIPANSSVILYASGKGSEFDSHHTNFKLSSTGEHLILSNQNGLPIDHILIPKLKTDISYGRITDGAPDWGYFDVSTPGSTNGSSSSFTCLLEIPTVDKNSGSYSGSVDLFVSHADPGVEIRYNLRGNNPTLSDPILQNSILLQNTSSVNNYSIIPTNPAFNYPMGAYSETRANNRGWVPPYSTLNTINVINIQAFKNGCIASEVVSRTFLIDENHDLDVLSIQTDSLGFFSDEEGIYVWGNDPEGNYNRRGIQSERKSAIDFFNEEGDLIFSHKAGIRIGGSGSRHSTQKNINVFFRGTYDDSFPEDSLFEDSELNRWKRLTFRSGGHRPDCLPKDEFASELVSSLAVGHSKYRYASTYLNGEYWGIHAVKERLNRHYLEAKYNLPRDSIAFLGNEGDLLDGTPQDSIDYKNLVDFAKANDLNNQANFDTVTSQIDINNFTDYFISEIFLGNADWPNSNIKFWRKRTQSTPHVNAGHDGKWRWLLFDLDGSFGGSCNDVYVTFNTLNWALRDDASFEKYTALFRNLIDNDHYKTDFINRTCDLVNSSFKASVTRPKLQSVKNNIDLDINNHIDRWRYPSTSNTLADRYNETPNTNQWEYLTAQMDTFLIRRPHYVRKHMFDEWGLSDSIRLEVDVNDQNMGSVKVNTIVINENLEGVPSNTYPWTGVYFSDLEIPLKAIPKEGYRFVEWIETGNTDQTIFITLNSDSLFTARFEIDPDYEPLLPIVINEVQSNNGDTYQDEYLAFDDWVELYNPNDTAVNINGYYLTDEASKPTKYAINNDLIIPANGHLIIWCDNESEQGLNHTNFGLNKFGDFIGLVSSSEDFVDSLSFEAIYRDYSYGRKSDGDLEWTTFQTPTPNAPNEIIESETIPTELVVYPNPNKKGILYFSKEITGAFYNSHGAIVLRFESTQQVETLGVSQGIYYLQTNEGITRKVLLIH
ncbi:MAG: hypothetical protein COA32_07165 [Fluviicola sp.]|nr:MAG: hypothetical protein COA32_07165 [Fluviicola sp.]